MNNGLLIHVCNNNFFQFVVHDVYLLLPTVVKVSVKGNNGNESSVTVRLYGPNTDLAMSLLLLFCY
jgi:hypothetical protein